jgi:hypothetical protein
MYKILNNIKAIEIPNPERERSSISLAVPGEPITEGRKQVPLGVSPGDQRRA